MATLGSVTIILFVSSFTLLISQIFAANTTSTEKRQTYFQRPIYYANYVRQPNYYVLPEYYGAPSYFRSPTHYYSPYYGTVGPNHGDLDRGGFSFSIGLPSRPTPIRDYLNQLILKQFLLRFPALNKASNTGDVCQASSTGDYGTCLSRAECTANGGQVGNTCGFSTFCCTGITVSKCGAHISLNNTYWSPPSTLNGVNDCSTTLKLDSSLSRQGNSICQVRLDFVDFDIAQPTSGTKCSSSAFQVSGATNPVPDICGSNSGQHMYLHTSSNEIKLNFNLNGNGNKKWKIKISQIPCSSSYLAPSDCLQYYSGASTTVSTFYSQNVQLGRSARPRNSLDSLDDNKPHLRQADNGDSGSGSKGSETPARVIPLDHDPAILALEIPDEDPMAQELVILDGLSLMSWSRSDSVIEGSGGTDDVTTSTTTTTPAPTTTTKPTTPPPVVEKDHVYRKIQLGDKDVKICYKRG